MKKGDLLFVYGTLRRGESADLSRHRQGGGASFVAEDEINGEIYNLGWFPGVKAEAGSFDPGKSSVRGDVFLLCDDRIGAILDGYEGYPNLYTRFETETAAGRTVWVYIYNHEVVEQQRIVSGDWTKRDGPVAQVPLRAG